MPETSFAQGTMRMGHESPAQNLTPEGADPSEMKT